MNAKTKRKNSVLIAVSIAVASIVVGSIAMFSFSQPLTSLDNNTKPIVMHIHPAITILGGKGEVALPTNIGINPVLWKDHKLDQFGMQGMSPLHTHDSSGTIHVESNTERDFTLGEFLAIWGGLDPNKVVNVGVNDDKISDYSSHVFRDQEKITIELV